MELNPEDLAYEVKRAVHASVEKNKESGEPRCISECDSCCCRTPAQLHCRGEAGDESIICVWRCSENRPQAR